MTVQSALEDRLGRFVRLEPCERTLLHSLKRSNVERRKGARLVNIGDATDKVWVLQSGWAVLKSHSKQHGSQILRTYLPGDFIGLAEFGTKRASHQIVMLTDGIVSEISRKRFHLKIAEYPRLASLLSALGSLNLTAFHYQVACLNTMSAEDTLKFLLLQVCSRSRAGQFGLGDRFELPMTQVEIGQVLGLTSIYVNKLLRRFKDEGQLEIERPYYRLLKRQAWEVETSFVDAYADIDTSWFPSEIYRPRDEKTQELPRQMASHALNGQMVREPATLKLS